MLIRGGRFRRSRFGEAIPVDPGPVPSSSFDVESWRGCVLGEAVDAPLHLLNGMNLRAFGRRLNGHLLVVAKHEPTGDLHVWTDRFGTIHAYYGDDGERTALGTRFQDVAAAASRRELDWEALTYFFGTGFFPADRTHYSDVRILRPATHYRFGEEGGLEAADRYWGWSHEPDRDRTQGRTVEELAERMQEVVREQAGHGRVALPISGGLDSRTAVAALDAPTRSASDLWAYSYGYTPDSMETRIARRIGHARDLPVETYTIGEYLFDRIREAIDATEGFQDLTQHRQTAIAPELNTHADRLIAAHWGDVWLDDAGAEPGISDRDLVDLGRRAVRKPHRWLMDRLCRPHIEQEPESLIHAQVRCGLEAVSHIEEPDFRLKAFKTEQWSFRWTLASLRAYQTAAFPRLPFYDTRLTDFLATVPTSYLTDRRLQVAYLKRHAPDLARITWEAERANLYLYRYLRPLTYPRAAVRKAGRLLRGRKPVQRNWEVQFLSARGREGLRQWLLEPGLALHDFVPVGELETLLAELRTNPTAANGYTTSMLVTFSAWLELHHRV